jgi:tRNA(Ile)-lysidine synthase
MGTGLALSGGVDSMALAFLWSQLLKANPVYRPFFRAFIVDHGARPGSSEEAKLVRSNLENVLFSGRFCDYRNLSNYK